MPINKCLDLKNCGKSGGSSWCRSESTRYRFPDRQGLCPDLNFSGYLGSSVIIWSALTIASCSTQLMQSHSALSELPNFEATTYRHIFRCLRRVPGDSQRPRLRKRGPPGRFRQPPFERVGPLRPYRHDAAATDAVSLHNPAALPATGRIARKSLAAVSRKFGRCPPLQHTTTI